MPAARLGDPSSCGSSISGNISATVFINGKNAATQGNSSRYIHVGHLSDGCVTFYELIKWNDIYDYLICRRVKGEGGKYVGELLVEK